MCFWENWTIYSVVITFAFIFCFYLSFFAIFMGNIWKWCLNDELIYKVQRNFTVFKNRIYVNILNLKKKMIIIIKSSAKGHYKPSVLIKSSAKGHYKPSAFIYLCMYLFIYLFIYTLFTKFVDHHLNTYD